MRPSARIALWYLIAATAWIITSDVVVGIAASESAQTIMLNNLKGVTFVVVTTGLLYWVLEREFSRREAAEGELRMIRRAVENLEEGVIVTDNQIEQPGPRIEYVNSAMERITGFSEEELIGQTPRIFQGPETDHDALARVRAALLAGEPVSASTTNYRKDGTPYIVDWDISPVPDEQGRIRNWVAVIRDVTDRVQAEELLKAAEERYRSLVEQVPAVIYTITADQSGGYVQFVSPQVEQMFGYTPEAWVENPRIWQDRLHPDDRERVISHMVRHFEEKVPFRLEYRIVHRDGRTLWIQDEAAYDRDANGGSIWRGVLTDITRLKQTEAALSHHVGRLAALRAIDLAITSNLEKRAMLGVVLEQVIVQLHADAAAILLLDDASETLNYAVGHGFSDMSDGQAPLSVHEGVAGRAVREQTRIVIPDVSLDPRTDQRIRDLSEGRGAYVAAPLSSKANVTGLLEVFMNAPGEPEADWLSFLDAVASQAAIAIDNLTLVERLQRSNEALQYAYDATLAGLAGALELRDDETGGHSDRVTALTVELACSLDLDDEQLVNIRRGALLHDVGKIGIPDQVLRKAGPLNPREWELMKQHPALGRQLLLRCDLPPEVLEIPYCHHERWDGSGYPRGLSGTDIRISARIFAVVDVWDALTRDRPYRTAWSREEAYEYLSTEAGRLFDPEIVDVFLTRVLQIEPAPTQSRSR